MTCEFFETVKFHKMSLALIEQANAIIAEYQALSFTLTLRQLFYQFVSRQWLSNTLAEYKRLGKNVKNGRRAGLIDWDAIEDRTRNVRSLSSWKDRPRYLKPARRNIARTFGKVRSFGQKSGSRKTRSSALSRASARNFAFPISPVAATIRNPSNSKQANASRSI